MGFMKIGENHPDFASCKLITLSLLSGTSECLMTQRYKKVEFSSFTSVECFTIQSKKNLIFLVRNSGLKG